MNDKKIRKNSENHQYEVELYFWISVTLLVCVSGSFPYYEQIPFIATSLLYQHFDVNDPFLCKVGWSGFFLSSDGGPIRWIQRMQDTRDACKAKHEDPANTDCEDGIFDLVRGAIQNVIIGTMGWHSGLGPNGDFLMVTLIRDRFISSNRTNSLGSIHDGIASTFIGNGGVLVDNNNSRLETRNSKGNGDIVLQVHNTTFGYHYDVIIRPKNSTCGTLLLGSSTDSLNISKRTAAKVYPLYEGYFGTDYCANQNKGEELRAARNYRLKS
ncbi:hypothetical protein TPHA_0C05025 [Tetrapisispora phaffii CBS 4417]|uniref:Uncharacterized protein n=1 Tax=Tetrapisispora phaffii (strain ATCC 24235 / CBS 4417 / NBRC 1672 / NRRL Y-8282 / UCD 70-5) TaxID=1071381 RepID=G8BQY9_TETPH|nr:hypothetical protein TPHA_0C05025 [Tetrapisispora phaffii CBS 4417]CCE62651.1 hypothetical protein TPHA_0C05025 [Tetrapisispora phaffii CBS 4417]